MAISSDQLAQALVELARALQAAQIPFAVAGAHAVAIHGHPRATRDIDVMTRAEFRDAAHATMSRLGYSRIAESSAFAQYVIDVQMLRRDADEIGVDVRAMLERLLDESSRREGRSDDGSFELRI